jgi:chromosomal replication initiator protein
MDQDVTLSTQTIISTPSTVESRVGDAIVELLIQRIGRERFEMWFAGPSCIRQEQTSEQKLPTIMVAAENMYSLNRIKSTFGSELRMIVDQVCGTEYDIGYRLTRAKGRLTTARFGNETPSLDSAPASFQTELPLTDCLAKDSGAGSAPSSSLQEPGVAAEELSRDRAGESTTRPHFASKRQKTLKSFWFGSENRLAEASVAQILEQPGQFSPFFIYGPTGSGKTHLLEAILFEFRRGLKQKRCVMLSAEQFTSYFVASLRGGEGLPMFRRKYRDLDLLVIDDIQFLAGKKATVGEFYHTVDHLVKGGKQVVVTADRPAIELGLLGSDFGNRLHAGLSCPLRQPALAGRIEITKRLCTERNIQLSPSIIEFVAERLPGDIRRISGAINRLHAYRLSVNSPITREIAENELNDLFIANRNPNVSLTKIESAVCELCGLKPAELKSESRQKAISTARMLAMYLSRQHTASPYSEIGDYFGGRSHSTVIAAQKKVHQWLERNEGVALPHATYRAQEIITRLESNLRIG